jgi:putative tryptophan/tyrosine transport system substrate-binding protein
MDRRTFLKSAAATALYPSVAVAQRKDAVIGFLASPRPDQWASFVTPFKQGLAAAGYVENKNITIEYRWADGEYGRLPSLADDLVKRKVDVIVASGGDIAMRAARNVTSTTPIISTFGGDPVRQRLIESYHRPGTNISGVSLLNVPLEGKRLEFLQQVFTNDYVFGLMVNTNNPNAQIVIDEVESAAHKFGLKLYVVRTTNDRGLDPAFSDLARAKVASLLVSSDPWFTTNAKMLVSLAKRHSLPTMYFRREFVDVGGLMSYGTRYPDAYRQMGIMTAQIVNGAKIAEMPVHQSTRFEFVLNFKVAQELDIQIPPSILLRADEVLESS